MRDNNGVLLEDINHKLDAILEGEDSLADISRQVKNINKRLVRVETNMQVMLTVISEHSRDLQDYTIRLDNHEQRIYHLGQPA